MDSSACRRAVAERWSKVKYRPVQNSSDSKQSRSSTASSTDIEDTEDVRPSKKLKPEIIDLTNSSDEEAGESLGGTREVESNFKLIKSDVFDSSRAESSHFISFDRIFGDRTLKRSVLFSYQYELDFLLEQFHSRVSEIILVAQTGTIRPCSTPAAMSLADRLSIIEVYMPQFTCHHSKMIINFYDDDSCRIFMPSNNFTYAEVNYPQQVCWCSPKLERSKEVYVRGTSAFHDSLLDYLGTYKQKGVSEKIIPKIRGIDFAPLRNITFIFSAPSKEIDSGFQQLASVLSESELEDRDAHTHHYICQSSTVGAALSKKSHANLFTHVFIPILHGMTTLKSKLLSTETLLKEFEMQKLVPHLIYPTVEEIRTSPLGWLCSGWFHFNYNRDMAHYDMLSKQFRIFRKQDPKLTSQNRKATPSHSKFYMKLTREDGSRPQPFENLDWCVYTSSNLSQTAWGTGTARPRNYEVGILLTGGVRNLVCGSFTDIIYRKYTSYKPKPNSQLVLVPFTMPFIPYDNKQGDEAFCMSKDYNFNDINGVPYSH